MQVSKYSGACHKSYCTREEALKSFDDYMKRQSVGAATYNCNEAKCSSSTSDGSSSKKPKEYERIAHLVAAQMELERQSRQNALKMEELSSELKEIIESLHLGEDK